MRIVEYDKYNWVHRAPMEMICAVYKHNSENPKEFSEIMKRVARKGGLNLKTDGLTFRDERSNNFLDWRLRQLTVLYWAAGGKIEGERIVDLGCGSTGNTYEHRKYAQGTFGPNLARSLAYLGADVVGVDYGTLLDEPFNAYSGVNLLSPGCLDFIPDKSVRVVHTSQLYTSPQLALMVSGREEPSGSIEAGNKIATNLLPQIERILRDDGYYVYYENMEPFINLYSGNSQRFQVLDNYGVHVPLEDIICGMEPEDWITKNIPCFCPKV